MSSEREAVSVFSCGGELCKDGQPHKWDGSTARTYHDDGSIASESGSCSKCGLSLLTWMVWNMPCC